MSLHKGASRDEEEARKGPRVATADSTGCCMAVTTCLWQPERAAMTGCDHRDAIGGMQNSPINVTVVPGKAYPEGRRDQHKQGRRKCEEVNAIETVKGESTCFKNTMNRRYRRKQPRAATANGRPVIPAIAKEIWCEGNHTAVG